jgi:hypothetical protein
MFLEDGRLWIVGAGEDVTAFTRDGIENLREIISIARPEARSESHGKRVAHRMDTEHPAHRIDELLPWHWKTQNAPIKQAA